MDTLHDTAPTEAQTDSAAQSFAELDAIQADLLALVAHFRLVDQRLWNDFAELPEEYQPAATVLHRATAELDALHSRLDWLNVRMADLKHPAGWRERLRAECSGVEETPETVQ